MNQLSSFTIMRQGLPGLLLALSPCLIAQNALATEPATQMQVTQDISVESIESSLFSKQSEMDASSRQVADKKAEIRRAQAEQSLQEKQSAKFDKKLKKTKVALDRDFNRLTNEPEFDLRPSKQAYQAAWADVKQNQMDRLEKEQQIQELYAELSLLEVQQKKLKTDVEALEQQKVRARVERLRTELKQKKQLTVSFTNVCNESMTLAGCKEQTQNLGLQKAVNQFQAELIEETSEPKRIKQHLASTSLNIHVINHNISKSGFYDGIRYRTILDVDLEARPAKNTPCKLLGVDTKYCFDKSEEPANGSKQKEVPWVTLTIRSNQHQDSVAIDGVKYGSTPVDIMLPVGPHMVTVEKEGYRSFHQELKIKSDHTLRAVLREKDNLPHSGRVFADTLKNSVKAPEMIVVGSGQYLISEHGSKQVNIDDAYALSSTPVTVSQFELFINSTNYQTDAELKNICTTVNDTQIIPVADSYWRNPGFKQTADSPAVCISQDDAKAYVKWLSKETGYIYRLPTETEWEVAARAGTKTNFWWGDSFGAGQANTGWGGTQWSNVSTSPVRTFAPNSFGLYDVVGNVWEWTSDRRGITKGGAWSFSPNQAAAHNRLFLAPNTASNYVGFRILREL